jgi:large conductance mechanosensitive channel
MIKEFKEFILKGNMIDMAVGIIIGAAFGTVVKSLVDNIIMPPIGMILNGIDFSNLRIVLQKGVDEVVDASGAVTNPGSAEVAIAYGTFINDAITLVIVGFCVFMLIKAVNKLRKKEAEAPATPPKPSPEETLLTEIRDLLARK